MSFTRLDPTDFVVSVDSITAPAWSSNQPTLTTFFTSSATTTAQNAFYLNVYQTASSANGAAVQFSIAGSTDYNQLVPGVSPSLTTYKQYRTLVYGTALMSADQGFNFGGFATNSLDILAVNVDRSRYKESLFPGTFNLRISGSDGEVQLCDNSNDTSVISYLDCGRVYQIVSGSNGHATSTGAPLSPVGTAAGYTIQGSYGLFLPDIATIILNPRALTLPGGYGGIGLVVDTTSNASTPSSSINNDTLFTAISQSSYFQLNSQETVSSDYVFIRIRNNEYNYTTNPTFISGSGDLVFPTLINNPQTFITTVGLYNTNNDLLAVAKMSRPLVKDFTKEALLRVKLDW